MVEFGRDPWGSPCPTPWSSRATKASCPALSRHLLNIWATYSSTQSPSTVKKVLPYVLLQLINMVSRHFEKYFDFGVETFFYHLTHIKGIRRTSCRSCITSITRFKVPPTFSVAKPLRKGWKK